MGNQPRWTNIERPIEEETFPFYRLKKFYPIHIGELLNSRYKVLGKLGYGSYSTVWLCHDKTNYDYVAVKVLTTGASEQASSREVNAYEHLSRLGSSHIGGAYIRGLYDTFDISGPNGVHRCLVQPPMHLSIHELRLRAKSCKFSEPLLKQTLICILQALDFLHREANIVHSDIKASNILLSIDDESILAGFEKGEQESPSPRKIVDSNRTIYKSRKLSSPRDGLWGQPVLCDLGEARIGKLHRGNIQPYIYKAPEVLFDMQWSFGADIWNLGVMIWDIFENKHLFNALDEDGEYSPSHHVAEMVSYLGPPPLHFLQRSQETRHAFDENGKWLGAGGVCIPSMSLEESEENLSGQNQQAFLGFMRSMLQWVPEERKSAKELLNDPWLNDS
ncbi:kinase domain protein [Aspergillus sclerotiicarbonarius CBS 121057]|uniref:non-specific serine/threonine protein kinase n=1 Tax=Aspergillus sclerotiicarbonarius (strain CBS 121057 / IBT 28362) TaxID=1448318 RepID=A0A319EF56_ASPSB|nr:kinase domain protein [Aspergillus sclerotiicarbonarius CBS 121057]